MNVDPASLRLHPPPGHTGQDPSMESTTERLADTIAHADQKMRTEVELGKSEVADRVAAVAGAL